MPLTNGSHPMKPVRGCACACAIRCSAPPKPISSRTSSTGCGNKRCEIVRRGRAQIKRQARQQRTEQLGLPRAQRMPLAPAEERAVLMRRSSSGVMHGLREAQTTNGRASPGHFDRIDSRHARAQNAFFSCAARSVFSQEKPPSFSGARPK